jgi:formylglycine-generating enzyme required for sulfatase activity
MTVSGKEDPLSLVGTTIVEKYAIESVVGHGGFATVYRATHLLWKRAVAVKVFTALGEVAAGQRKQLLDDFIQEGALLAELSERSSAICQARDVGMLTSKAGETVPFMVLEWLDGKPLDAVLEDERKANAPLRSLEEAVRLLDPIAEALALAHKKGIAHRDVKPANFFVLGPDARAPLGVKLLDFGIAKVVQDAQKMGFGKTAGHITSFTPLYGAPEQFNRQYGATGPWTDVFALALVVAEVASGKEPMPGDNLVQLAYAASDPNRRPTPRTLGVALSDEVEAIFRKAVAVKPEERFQTAGEFWSALHAKVLGDRLSTLSSSRSLVAAPPANADTIVDTGPSGSYGQTAAQAPPSSARAPDTSSRTGLLIVLGAVGACTVGGMTFAGVQYARSHATPPASSSAAPVVSSAPPAASSVAPAVTPGGACPAGMVAIPGGDYFMGSDEKDAQPNEKPAHKVRVSPYCIDEHEVTVAQYKECSDHGSCRRAGKQNVWPGITAAQQKIYDPLCNAADPSGKGKHPINCVDWEQSREYCEAQGARLPTEAEWELAARGPDGRIYPWGDDPPSAKLLNACGKECVAWMKKHPDPDVPPKAMYDDDDGFANTSPVGSFPLGASRYGVKDVVGNVWEWVGDWYGDYGAGAATDPKGPEKGTDKVIRGGSWNGSDPSWVRPSFRFHVAPTARSYGFGFRCAKSR